MKQILVNISVVFLSLALFCQSAFAYRVGQTEVSVITSAFVAHDDNITLSQDNKKSDNSMNLNLALTANYAGKTNSLDAILGITHEMYNKYSGFDNTSENLNLLYQQELTAYDRIKAKETFLHAEEPQTFEDAFGQSDGRYSYVRNNIGFDYTKDISQQLSLIGRFANEVYEVSRNDRSDSTLYQLGVEADYALSSRTITYAAYDFFQRSFSPGSEITINGLGVGARHFFTSKFYGDARAGMNLMSANHKNYNKPFFQLSFTDEFSSTRQIKVSFTKQYTANAYNSDLFDYWQASANFMQQLLERLRANINAFWGKGKYKVLAIEDKMTGASLNLDYDLLRNTKLMAQYSYSKVSSNVNTRGYKRNYVSLGIRIEF